MYIPMFKNRAQEHSLITNYSYLFENNNLMPYIEIIREKLGRKDASLKEIIEYYDNTLKSNYFVELFGFKKDKYKRFDNKQTLASRNISEYSASTYYSQISVTEISEKAIPVIPIHKDMNYISKIADVDALISVNQKKNKIIGVRLEAELFDEFFEMVNDNLRENDYLFFDINEKTLDSFVLETIKLNSLKGKYNLILAYSPRKRDFFNGEYPDGDYTNKIACITKKEYLDEGFDGISDYAGLKDEMPTSGGRGEGRAIALFFDNYKEKYYSIVNTEITDGIKGYSYVIKELLKKETVSLLDGNNCLAYDFIKKNNKEGKKGNWGTWKYITALRVLSEKKKV